MMTCMGAAELPDLGDHRVVLALPAVDLDDLVAACEVAWQEGHRVWSLPPDAFARFVAGIPAPLGIGKVSLEDGSAVSGFLCEAHAVAGAEEITRFGGWRAFLAERAP